MRCNLISFLICIGLLNVRDSQGASELKKNFYKKTCPNAENIVRSVIWRKVAQNKALPAKILRLHFHDFFVRGCDASILLESSANDTEKTASPNFSVAGYDEIDEAKTKLEQECPGVVSCADILALAARDGVSFQYQQLLWEVRTGRRDGVNSVQSEAIANLPSPFSNFSVLKQSFANQGLSVKDLVVLSGAHTIGEVRCNFISSRLYNFAGTGAQDPSLEPTYAAALKTRCRDLVDGKTTVSLDPGSPFSFDNTYYNTLTQNRGLLQSDATLLTNKASAKVVAELLASRDFISAFGQSMKKMGAIRVLTRTNGQIRKNCRVVNSV